MTNYSRLTKSLLITGMLTAGHTATADTNVTEVLNNYSNIALAGYEDALTTAESMHQAIEKMLANPTDDTLAVARKAWRDARVPYMQTEVYRFGNTIVDDWEGKVNAWPLDEGLIDYVDTSSYGSESDENLFYAANVIANTKLTFSGTMIDATTISKSLLAESLQEADGNEANVATGYHAVEFLLWGQDLNGTAAGAGNRPVSDFDQANCTNGNCDRRAAYLSTVTKLLIDDLEWMVAQWQDGGAARAVVMADSEAGINTIVTGMGSLSYGELAGERMKLGLILHDPEEEHDCFADNTHASHFYDALGIQNVYAGTYTRVDGSEVSGPALKSLVMAKDAAAAKELDAGIADTMKAMQVMYDRAVQGEAYDQMIGEGNTEGNAIVQKAIDSLVNQTKGIDKAATVLGLGGIEFEGSDSLDTPDKVGA